MTIRSQLIAALAVALLCGIPSAKADLILTAMDVAATEDFQSFTGSGFSPGASAASGELDSNTWRVRGFSDGDGSFGGNHTAGDFARGASTGGVSTGGTYAFDVGGGDVGLGVQQSGADFTPGDVTVRVQNGTGVGIDRLRIQASAFFLNDQDRSSRWNIGFSTDDVTYNFFPFDLDSPEAADLVPAWSPNPIDVTFSLGSTVAAGDQLFLQFRGDDLGGSGSRDEFALTSFSVTAVPEPSAVALLGLVGVVATLRRRSRS